ncbi:tRNA (adenosine(37)-N6)-threonylcarbamoyltransferase complex ATPase subunit type 1 TsaE [Peptoniphilus sp. oral taxon 386]|uniref:tRNA (adenosine(37)-N6)-threonylcarbamoyltransferase complex ATPase subunit type 1 TsaE n=2 Tax=Peptoniphilus TaxID=162289 RepID=UPI0020D23A53|nr:tRNA (adenosine(37)-N6)-threonylcarbamoyltransferase complex ATPase subunit type 1 TsaE [Peptoniphilus sp. oral taxon 386]
MKNFEGRMELILNNLEETKKFGEKLGSLLKKGDVVCLNGDLAAGKTTLTKSIGIGMGIDDYITSPTFTIVNEYYGKLNLYHFDTYRLEGDNDVYYLGFDEYFYGDGVCVVEWADRISSSLPECYLELNITQLDENKRKIEINAVGDRAKELMEDLR